MNKTKLEVIRINEDVIATSGGYLPNNASYLNLCWKFDNSGTQIPSNYVTAYFNDDQKRQIQTISIGDESTFNQPFANSQLSIEKDTWYAVYSDGTNWYVSKCSDHNHDSAPLN